MPQDLPAANDREHIVTQSAYFLTRAPGTGDMLPNSEEGLGEHYRCGGDVTMSSAWQMSRGTDPEIRSTNAWLESRYAVPGWGYPAWREDRDHAEIPNSDRYFLDKSEFIRAFDIDGLDHIGHVGLRTLTPIINGTVFPSEFRSGPPANFNELYRQFRLTHAPLPEDVVIEISLRDEDMGSFGQTPQVRVLERAMADNWVPMTIDELITQRIIEGVSEHVGEVRDVDWESLYGYFLGPS